VGKTDQDVLSPAVAAVVVPVKRAVIETGMAQRVEYREPVDGSRGGSTCASSPSSAPTGQ
jgi:hypothetical protein